MRTEIWSPRRRDRELSQVMVHPRDLTKAKLSKLPRMTWQLKIRLRRAFITNNRDSWCCFIVLVDDEMDGGAI